jgi:putative ABC transport system permease protein
VTLQFVGFTLILIALVTVGLVRSHLMTSWQNTVSTAAPNYFAINIAPTDLPALKTFFATNHLLIDGLYPMVRGRLTGLNGQPILSAVPLAAANNNALHRELNLSWMLTPPADNKMVSGRPLSAQDQGAALVSVEQKLADDLHLKLGDALTFQMGERTLNAKIVNLRSVDWSSFHPNFFMIFPPGVLETYPVTYITSFHLAAEQTLLLNQLVQQFPNITVIDIASLLAQAQDLLNKVTIAVQYLFLFALGAGILIFMVSLQASVDERQLTYRLLHILGASRRYITQSVLAEFVCLFSLIALSTTGLSYFIVYMLVHKVFNIS